MEKHSPDPRGQALVEYMVKGAMEAYDKATTNAHRVENRGARISFEAAIRERMAQVANTVTLDYCAIAERSWQQALTIGVSFDEKAILEAALGPVEP